MRLSIDKKTFHQIFPPLPIDSLPTQTSLSLFSIIFLVRGVALAASVSVSYSGLIRSVIQDTHIFSLGMCYSLLAVYKKRVGTATIVDRTKEFR